MIHYVNVFISHSWAYSGHYDKLAEWLFEEGWTVGNDQLIFVDQSVPKGDPIHHAPNDQALQTAIFQRIAASDIVVIPTGMYANYSKWINKEIDGAQTHGKNILAVSPWAQQKQSSTVQEAAIEIVGWSQKSVGQGVWNHRV